MLGQSELGSYAIGELSGGAAAYELTAEAGSFAFTGSDAGTVALRLLTASVGSFALTGNAALTVALRRDAEAAGAFSRTGQDAGLTATRILYARPFEKTGQLGFGALGEYGLGQADDDATAAFRVNFHPAELTFARNSLTASAGAFSLTFVDAALDRFLGIRGDVGTIAVTFNAASLRHNRVLIATSAQYTISSGSSELARTKAGLRLIGGGGRRGLRASAGGGASGLRIRA